MIERKFVEKIYDLAMDSYNFDEVPVGAIIVKNKKIIGIGINSRDRNKSVVGHAEINAIEEACKYVGDWRLDDCEMYVTLLPCLMCAGAILESRIKKVYFLCNRTNVCFDTLDYLNASKIVDVEYEEKYLNLLRLFFENKRN